MKTSNIAKRPSRTEFSNACPATGADPVREYLAQLDRYPLLSPDQETAIALQLQHIRRRLKRALLSNHYMLACAVKTLAEASQGRLRADSVLDISQFNAEEYRTVMNRLSQSMYRLERLTARNRRDAARLCEPATPAAARRPFARRLKARCRFASSLVWDVKLRLHVACRYWRQLHPVWERMLRLARTMQKSDRPAESQAELQAELAGLVASTGMPPRSLTRWMAFVGALMSRYDALKQRLARHNLRLVVSIAKHYVHQEPGLLDLIQEGNAGLLRAADKFEPIGCRFSTYATWWIKQAILQSLSEHGMISLPQEKAKSLSRLQKARRRWIARHGRIPTFEEEVEACELPVCEAETLLHLERPILSLDLASPEIEGTLGELVEDQRPHDVSGRLDRDALSTLVRELLVQLKDRERQVIELRYGLLDGRFRTLDEIGAELGVSGERVRQIEQRAVGKLRLSQRRESLLVFLD